MIAHAEMPELEQIKNRNLTVLKLEQRPDFVETQHVKKIAERAVSYLKVGYPVHFSGPSGTGKTTFAMHVAQSLGRPVMLLHGDDEYGSSDLVGADYGYRKSKVIDNYISSVMKTEENMMSQWVDNRLTTACKYGFTLVYDEFTRSRPEANNILLTILEEKLLEMPKARGEEPYIQVHPGFRAIFTSNPEEYAGVHKSQDALMDRMVSIKMGHLDRDTEISITEAKSGISRKDAEVIVNIVRDFRQLGVDNHRPTIRACIMIGKVTAYRKACIRPDDPVFREICVDILNTDTIKIMKGGKALANEQVYSVIEKHCRNGKKTTLLFGASV
ncbi:MAG: gas vesicle protein GvpN [Planctomycetota bacterium]|mgnify:FL=1